MSLLNRSIAAVSKYPERIIQFGEGNFLRAFVDSIVQEMNEKAEFDCGVVVVQPIENGLVDLLNKQEGLFTLYLNGIKDGKLISEHKLIDCIQRGVDPYTNFKDYLEIAKNESLRYVISNTTEAGIAYQDSDTLESHPPKTFPGKLALLLYKRFQFFKGASDKGLIVLPCELIDKNGENLKKIVLRYAAHWHLEQQFIEWVNENNVFYNTMVDRIVPGYPQDKIEVITQELGYKDELVVEGELFHMWVLEGPSDIQNELPFKNCGLNIICTHDITPYRSRKVQILNGAHTLMVPLGYLSGIETVRECMEDPAIGKFIRHSIFNEIGPTLNQPEDSTQSFSDDVIERFLNPYLEHKLIDISLNSISKFKTRVLPSIIAFVGKNQVLPRNLVFSLSATIVFYKRERGRKIFALNDNDQVKEFFKSEWGKVNGSSISINKMVKRILARTDFWGQDLNKINDLAENVTTNVFEINTKGMKLALTEFLSQDGHVE